MPDCRIVICLWFRVRAHGSFGAHARTAAAGAGVDEGGCSWPHGLKAVNLPCTRKGAMHRSSRGRAPAPSVGAVSERAHVPDKELASRAGSQSAGRPNLWASGGGGPGDALGEDEGKGLANTMASPATQVTTLADAYRAPAAIITPKLLLHKAVPQDPMRPLTLRPHANTDPLGAPMPSQPHALTFAEGPGHPPSRSLKYCLLHTHVDTQV